MQLVGFALNLVLHTGTEKHTLFTPNPILYFADYTSTIIPQTTYLDNSICFASFRYLIILLRLLGQEGRDSCE